MTDPNEFQRLLHGDDLNSGLGSSSIVIKAVVVRMDSFHISYRYEFYCTLVQEVRETLGDMSRYGFYIWDSRAMKAVRTKNIEFSSKKKPDEDGNKSHRDGNDM